MSEWRRFVPLAIGLLLLAGYLVGRAAASSGGRVFFSGNPATNGGGTCTSCHASTAAPAVVLAGPTAVDAGTTHTYTVTISGGPAVTAGFNVSVSGNAGVLAPAGPDTAVIGGEITHTMPKPFSVGAASFAFRWTAPQTNGPVIMYAAGNSSNGAGNLLGDGVNTATLLITVQNGPAATATPTAVPPPAGITLQQVASGLDRPVVITHALDGRVFIVEQPGRIRLLAEDGSLTAVPFLDISAQVKIGGGGSEQGLLGLAFHPDYARNGYFYVYYTYDPPGTNADRSRISRFTVSGSNPDQALPGSETILLEFEQPFANHNAGDIQFGPDGYLYIASGDGGGSFWSSRPPDGGGVPPAQYAQSPGDLLGKVLRIDVDGSGGSDCDITLSNRYGIPGDNAYTDGAGGAGCDEIWTLGLRNPWRMGFDRANGDLWLSDVGQSLWEEVNHIPAQTPGGLNFGFSCFEGNHSTADYGYFLDTGCEDFSAYTAPVFERSHAAGDCSITGGFVYRGSAWQDLYGAYFFTDYCRPAIRTLTGALPGGLVETQVLPVGQISSPSTFGQDVRGELYVASRGAGTVSRILGTVLAPTEATIRKTGEQPLIDGQIDPLWAEAQPLRINHLVRGSGALFDSNLHGRFRTLYDAAYLYVLVEVTDDSLVNDGGPVGQDDTVELYLDADRSQGATCSPGANPPHCYDGRDDYALSFRYSDPQPQPGPASAPVPPGRQSVLLDTPAGYVLEVSLPLIELGIAPRDGHELGLDVQVVDDDDGGDSERKLAWFNTSDDSAFYPQTFARGTLLDPQPGLADAGGLVWQDGNGDGQPVAEAALAAAAVRLLRQVPRPGPGAGTGTAVVRSAQTTAVNGRNFAFSSLDPATYYIDVDESTFSAAFPVNTTANSGPASLLLGEGAQLLDMPFGYAPLSSGLSGVGGKVYLDVDRSGAPGQSEPALCNIELFLQDAEGGWVRDAANNLLRASSDSFGNYAFTNLAPGSYTVIVAVEDADLLPHRVAGGDGLPQTVQNCDPAGNQVAGTPSGAGTAVTRQLLADQFVGDVGFGFEPVPPTAVRLAAPAEHGRAVTEQGFWGLLLALAGAVAWLATRRVRVATGG